MRNKTFKVFLTAILIFAVVGIGWAATHTRFVTGNPEYAPKDNSVFIISNTLDFSDLRTTGPSATGVLSGVTRGDTVQLLDIPAGTIVIDVGVNIYSASTVAGLTCHGVTIGDGSNVDGWMETVDFGPSASGVSVSSGGTTYIVASGGGQYVKGGAYGLGKYYETADTIDAVIPNWAHRTAAGLTDFVVRAWATCVKPSTKEAYTKPSPAI